MRQPELPAAKSISTILLLAGLAGSAAGSEVRSLRIAEREKTLDENGRVSVTYHLVNDSPKTITAREFSCVSARQAGGPTGQGGKGTDAYMSLGRRYELDAEPPETGLVPPGGRVRETIELRGGELDGPLAAKACAPTLLIFDDATFEGSAADADSWFARRAQTAVSAYRTREELESALAGGSPLEAALAAVVARRQRTAESPGGRDYGASVLEQFLPGGGSGAPADLQPILGMLDSTFQQAMDHLPRAWRREVRAVLAEPAAETLPDSLAENAPGADPAAAVVAIFDLDESGKPSSAPAVLFLDRDGDGAVDRRFEIFDAGAPQLLSDAPNGFRALAVFDDPFGGGNGDGVIDAQDPIYAWLQLWTDADRDGASSPAELEPLAGRLDAIPLGP